MKSPLLEDDHLMFHFGGKKGQITDVPQNNFHSKCRISGFKNSKNKQERKLQSVTIIIIPLSRRGKKHSNMES